jgi:hypothetical protein
VTWADHCCLDYEGEILEHRKSATSDDFNKWEQYLLDVLPKMVSECIKPRADLMTEGLMDQLPNIIRHCQEEAFNKYRETHQHTSASPPSTGDRLAPIAIAPPPMPTEHDQPSSAQIASSLRFQDGSGAGSSLDSGYLSVPYLPSWRSYSNLGDQGVSAMSTGSAPLVNKPFTVVPNTAQFNEDIFPLELGHDRLLTDVTGSVFVPVEANQFLVPAILLNTPPGPTVTADQHEMSSSTGGGTQIQTNITGYERPKEAEVSGNLTDGESEILFLDSLQEFRSL